MRTREQIIADCERRFAELQEEAERRKVDLRLTHPCETCRWQKYQRCEEPLVKAFGKGHRLIPYMPSVEERKSLWRDDKGLGWDFPTLCGPEKALWQPKLTIWQRIWQFLTGGE